MPSISGIIKSVSSRSNFLLRNASSAALAEAEAGGFVALVA